MATRTGAPCEKAMAAGKRQKAAIKTPKRCLFISYPQAVILKERPCGFQTPQHD